MPATVCMPFTMFSAPGLVGLMSSPKTFAVGTSSKLQALRPQLRVQVADAREVAARAGEARDKSRRHRVDPQLKNDGNRRRGRLGCQGRRQATERDHSDLTPNQIGGQRRQSSITILRPARLECHVLAVDVAGFAEAFANRTQLVLVPIGR